MEAKPYTNGYSKGPKMNGAKMNGANGHAVSATTKTQQKKKGPSFFRRLFSIAARLFTWYSILSILFRCPDTIDLCDETSPRICKPYFQVKHAVSPHLEPYYDTYAAPYVAVAKPYYDITNDKVLTPATAYATKYGAPALNQAQAYGQAQWGKKIQPQLAVYQKIAQDKYDETVAPHVAQASAALAPYYDIARTSSLQTYHEIILPAYVVAEPYAVEAYTMASHFARDTAIPSTLWAWNKTYVFLDTTVWPQLRVVYVENVEPQLARIGQRLGRYKEKSKAPSDNAAESLTSQASTATEFIASSASSASKHAYESASSFSASASSAAKSMEDVHIPNPSEVASHDETDQVSAPPAGENESEVRRVARETVQEDLESWQDKFAKAADEGASEIEDRVTQIAQQMIDENAGKIGKGFLKTLNSTVGTELDALRKAIISIVELSPPDAETELVNAVRRAGLAVKERAQEIRDWKAKFDLEMEASITKAAEHHFMILDGIRDLALQRIGMKWAWMDGVTYKDWAKYHELKNKFDEWTGDLKQLIVTHPGLEASRQATGEIEDAGMSIAQDAASELARLKQVALWKLAAGDVSDNFDSDEMSLAADLARQTKEAAALKAEAEADAALQAQESSLADEASKAASIAADISESQSPESENGDGTTEADAVEGVSEPEDDPLESAAHVLEDDTPADDLVDDQHEEPIASEVSSEASSVFSEATESLSSATDSAASVADDVSSAASESVTSILNAASDAVFDDGTGNSVEDPAESPVLGSTVIPGDDHTFVVSEEGFTPEDDDSMKPLTPEEKAEEKLEDQLEEEIISESVADEPLESETDTVKPAFLGAMAQEVPNRGGPILDTDEEETPDGYAEKAQEAYAQAVAQASEKYNIAMSAVSAKVYGTPEPEPVQQEMFAAVSARYAAATEFANARLNQALEAASKGVYGDEATATKKSNDWAYVESVAARRLQEGRIWAEEQYAAAQVALGFATATPTSSSEQMLEQAKLNYYAGLGAAHARYSEFMDAASSAMSSLTASQTPTDAAGTASSVAAAATESAGALASEASIDGLAAASMASEGVEAAASIVGEVVGNAAQEVIDAAEAVEKGVVDTWEQVVNQLSAQVYGTAAEPTPTAWYGAAYQDVEKYAAQASAQAAQQYEVVQHIVQELLVGKEPTFSESVVSRIQAAYATGAASASDYLDQAGQRAGDAREKVNAAAAAAADAIRDNVQGQRDEL